uniref:Ribosomal protein L6 n=1 Tax=Tryblionella apiculata TaxID=1003145 RepID=A0A8F1B7P7_9STRA|nr:ribosomal protein L6 [Tryblionella apiculata]QWM93598.1 ribosomal protein L6 [Tryblionella apiculata]
MFTSNKFKKKYTVKIPKNVNVIHCNEKNIITFIGPLQTKSLKLNVKIFLVPSLSLITVTNIQVSGTSATDFKNVKKIQGTTVAKVKQKLIEITYPLYHKLNLVGVGYRAFAYESLESQIYFKLGYSHLIYFKVPNLLNVHCQKFTKLFIFGNSSFDVLTQTAAQIRACKLPEPYKGKGILHNQETVILKKGKKI